MIVDNRPFVRNGLRSMICDNADFSVVGEAESIPQAIKLSREVTPTVVVISSLIQPPKDGDFCVTSFRELSPAPGVLILAPFADDHARRAVDAGAAGLLLEQCSPATMWSALRLVAAGYLLLAPTPASRRPIIDPGRVVHTAGDRLDSLTQREFDVFELLARGRSNLEICETLSLSANTVKSHVRSQLLKLGLRNRVETVIYAYQIGLIRAGIDHSGNEGELVDGGSGSNRLS